MVMKYVYEDFVDQDDIVSAEGQGYTINVRFCRDCPLFEITGTKPNSNIQEGWCRNKSCYSLDLPYSFYVIVNSNSFCNEDDIVMEEL